MWVVYILECSDGSYYTGITNNLIQRLSKHNSGKASKYTASRRPVKLAWITDVANRSQASKLECKIKSLSRNQKIQLIGSGSKTIIGL